jgi:hypothetical protein
MQMARLNRAQKNLDDVTEKIAGGDTSEASLNAQVTHFTCFTSTKIQIPTARVRALRRTLWR